MSTYAEAQRQARRSVMVLGASVVGVTVLAIAFFGFLFSKASQKLPVDPYIALAAGAVPADPEPKQAQLGSGSEGLHSPAALLRRALSKLRYDDERAVRRFLERNGVIGQQQGGIDAARFADRLLELLDEGADSEAEMDVAVRRAAVASFTRYPRDLLRVDPFGRYLIHRDAELRRLAVDGIAAHDLTIHADAVVRLAGDEDARVRESVAAALDGRRDDAAVEALLTLLRDANSRVIAAAGSALGRSLRSPFPKALLAACGDERGNVRMAVAEAIGTARGAEAAPLLAGLSRDNDWRVRRQAMRGLGRLRGDDVPAAVRALEDIAYDKSRVRTDRLEALQGLAAMPELAHPANVAEISDYDPDPVLRFFAARVRLTHGDLGGVDVLIALLDVARDGEHCDEEDEVFLRKAANETLREAFDIEGVTDARSVAKAAKRKLVLLDRDEFTYSPVRVYEFW